MKIKAAVLEKVGNPLVVREIQAPKLLSGQILVRVLYSGVCGSQLAEVRGLRGHDKWLPHLLGHEGSGIVVDVGPDVSKVVVEDSVILSWIKGSGLDAPGGQYKSSIGTVNSGPVTTFSDFTVVSENRVVRKPPGLTFASAVLFGCCLPTGAGIALKELKISASDSVLIIGLGGVGLAATMAVLALGAKNVIAIDTIKEKLEFSRSLGVKHACTMDKISEAVQQYAIGGVDCCIEASGRTENIERGFSQIRPKGGRLVFASHPPQGEVIRLSPHELISGKTIKGSWGGSIDPDIDIPVLVDLLMKMPIDRLLSKTYRLDQINDALEDLSSGKVFRPLIKMEHHGYGYEK